MLHHSEFCRRFLGRLRDQLALSSSRTRRGSRRDRAAAIFGVVQSAEVLEDRTLLTNYIVNTNTDDADDVAGTTDGQVSLREAINAAVSNAAFGDAPAGSQGVTRSHSMRRSRTPRSSLPTGKNWSSATAT